MVRQHREAFLHISPAPQESTRGQLARSLGTFAPVFPKARGLRHQSSSWCTQLSWAQTTMPHPTPVRTSGVSLGSRLPTLHFPCYSSQVSRVHNEGLKRNGVGGVLLNAPSPLWGSPIFLQGSIRLTWSPMGKPTHDSRTPAACRFATGRGSPNSSSCTRAPNTAWTNAPPSWTSC